MNDFWQDFLIQNSIGVILNSVKNPESKVKFRKAFLKVFNTIKAAFAGDPDFE